MFETGGRPTREVVVMRTRLGQNRVYIKIYQRLDIDIRASTPILRLGNGLNNAINRDVKLTTPLVAITWKPTALSFSIYTGIAAAMQIRRGTYLDVTRTCFRRGIALSLSFIVVSTEIILSQPWPCVKYAHAQRGSKTEIRTE
jgi:hypothetical protein